MAHYALWKLNHTLHFILYSLYLSLCTRLNYVVIHWPIIMPGIFAMCTTLVHVLIHYSTLYFYYLYTNIATVYVYMH